LVWRKKVLYRIELMPRQHEIRTGAGIGHQGLDCGVHIACIFGVRPVINHASPYCTRLPPVVRRVRKAADEMWVDSSLVIGIVAHNAKGKG